MAGEPEHTKQPGADSQQYAMALQEPRTGAQPAEGGAEVLARDEIEALLNRAARGSCIVPFRFDELAAPPASPESVPGEPIHDAELDVRIELGRTRMDTEDVAQLRSGLVVALDERVGDPVNVYIGGRLIARGEIVELNENFCVRVSELISPQTADAG